MCVRGIEIDEAGSIVQPYMLTNANLTLSSMPSELVLQLKMFISVLLH